MSSDLVVVSSAISRSSTTRAHQDDSEDEGIYSQQTKRNRLSPPDALAVSLTLRNSRDYNSNFRVTNENYGPVSAEHALGLTRMECQDQSTIVRMSNLGGGRPRPCLLLRTA